MEHASIGAFARFTLQLLSVGAPPRLLEAAQRAALDEISHARGCFAIAERILGRPVGPGPLGIASDSFLGTMDPTAIVLATVREGCIEETIGVIQAQVALQEAVLPEVRDHLERVAEEEARHAELAWDFVRWMAGRGEGALRGKVRAAFQPPPSRSAPRASPHRASWRAYGLLTPACRHEIERRAWAEVVTPTAEALMGAVGAIADG